VKHQVGIAALAALVALTAWVSLGRPIRADDSGAGGPSAATAARPLVFSPRLVGPAFKHRTPADNYFAVTVDLDGDRRQEILLTYFNFPPNNPNRSEPIKVLKADPKTYIYSNATSSLVAGTVPALVHPRVMATGDFNGDRKVDVFIGGHGYDQAPFAGERDWLLLSGSGVKHSGRIAPPGKNDFTHATAAGDIDGDGIDDIYVGALSSNRGPYFLLGRKGGVLVIANDRLNDPVRTAALRYTAAALTDIDGDGWKDLVLGTLGGADSVVYKNDRHGSFNHPSPDYVLPPGLFGRTNTIVLDILPVDLDNDGKMDLILSETKFNPYYQGYGLQVLINKGDGVFHDETAIRMKSGSGFNAGGQWRQKLIAADFFGDGIVDLVTERFCPSKRSDPVVWLNDGSGVLTPHDRTLFDPDDESEDCGVLVPADVDGNGRSDIARIVNAAADARRALTYINQGPPANAPAGLPAVVRAPPTKIKVAKNQRLVLSVLARGARPLRFQWFRGATPIAGATRPVYIASKANSTTAATYAVRISNKAGSVARSTVVTVQ
jgi:hypothetical protein